MIIGSWNIRGLCSPKKQRAIHSWVNKHKFDVFGIFETKMFGLEASGKFLLSFKNKGFDYFFGNASAGRILVFWKSNLHVTILDDFDQGVLCHVKDGVNFLFTGFIYGRNDPIRRKFL